MSEDPKPADGNLPPKLTLRKGESGAIPIPPPAPVSGLPSLSKKATTRIPLTSVESGLAADAIGTPGQDYATKTIRLTPLSASRPLSVAPAVRPPSATTSLSDLAKRQTSRIPLEAAMAADHTPADGESATAPDTPKTIRIKRPGQTAAPTVATVRATRPPTEPASGISVDGSMEKTKTSRVDIAELQAEEGAQATQRKTIKIRRADGTGAKIAPRNVAVARIEAEAVENVVENVARVNVAFPIMAAVALFLLGILVVVLAAQAFPSLGWNLPGSVTL